MPSKSPAQHRLMEAVAHDSAFARRVGISQSVGKDFAAADKRWGYAAGGYVRNPMSAGRPQVRPEDVASALEDMKRRQDRSPTFTDALGALSDVLTGGAYGAAKVSLGWPGDIEKSAVDLTGVDKKNSLYNLVAGDAPTQTFFPTSEDVGRYLPGPTQFTIPKDQNPYVELGGYAPITPGQVGRIAKGTLQAAKPALSGLGAVAAEAARRGVEEGRGPLGGLAAARMYAVKPRGGNFNSATVNSYIDDLRGWEPEGAVHPVNSWLQKTLGNYIKKDLGSPTDPLLQVEKEYPNLFLPPAELEGAGDLADRVNRMPPVAEMPGAWLSPQMTGGTAHYAKLAQVHRALTDQPLTPWGMYSGLSLREVPVLRQIADEYGMHGYEAPEYLKNAAPPGFLFSKSLTPEAQALAVLQGEKDIPNYSRYASRSEIEDIQKKYGWALKNPDATMWNLRGDSPLGFDHVRDYLNAATEPHETLRDWAAMDPADANHEMARDAARRILGGENLGQEQMIPGAQLARWRALHNAGLTIEPEQLARTSVADAVRKTAQWDEYLANSAGEASQPGLSQGIVDVHKEYPDGMRWVKLGVPNRTELPEGVNLHELPHFGSNTKQRGYHVGEPSDPNSSGEIFGSPEEAVGDYLKRYNKSQLEAGLNAEGDAMGHCVGGYCDDVASRGTQIYSLRDAKNIPHVTVEVRPSRSNRLGDLKAGTPTAFDIMQIKGKQNVAPVAKYLPHVQDFVKSGEWGHVGDLSNTGLVPIYPESELAKSFLKTGEQPPAYATQDELTELLKRRMQGGTPDPQLNNGYAAGGSVQAYTPPTVRQFLLDRLEG